MQESTFISFSTKIFNFQNWQNERDIEFFTIINLGHLADLTKLAKLPGFSDPSSTKSRRLEEEVFESPGELFKVVWLFFAFSVSWLPLPFRRRTGVDVAGEGEVVEVEEMSWVWVWGCCRRQLLLLLALQLRPSLSAAAEGVEVPRSGVERRSGSNKGGWNEKRGHHY